MTIYRGFFKTIITGLVFSLSLIACTTTPDKEDTNPEDVVVEERSTYGGAGAENGEGVSTSGMQDEGAFRGHELDDPDSVLAQRKVYFSYDKSDILEEYRSIVEAHANYLVQNPGSTITLEGHADERGSREYNIALGERRAQSVQRMMELYGVSSTQINVVSYGEERSDVDGHDESAWRFNRRAEIIYRAR